MASTTCWMPFLRPMGLPRPATVRHFLRISTSSHCAATGQSKPTYPQEDPNLIASRTSSPSYPPPDMRSLPRPKVSRASRRTNHPTKERNYPTRRPSHHHNEAPKLIPQPIEPLPEDQSAPNLPYFVTRTKSNGLPIYLLRKRGGNLKMTRVKHIDGDVSILRNELQKLLDLPKQQCLVNPLTRHVVMKGHFKPQIEKFLRERRF